MEERCKLGSNLPHKIFITCSQCNQRERPRLFFPAEGELKKLIAPHNYSEEDSLKSNISNYLKYKNGKVMADHLAIMPQNFRMTRTLRNFDEQGGSEPYRA
jgi:hypothetical protein